MVAEDTAADNTTAGVYSLGDLDAAQLYTVIQDNPLTQEPLPHHGFVSIDPDAVHRYAAATGDDQPIHVGDVPGSNVVHGALSFSWVMDALQKLERPVAEVEYARFTRPVHYSEDTADRVRLVEEAYELDDLGARVGAYRLEKETGEDPLPVVDLRVRHGEPGANTRYSGEEKITNHDFAAYVSAVVGSFFDRSGASFGRGGDVLLTVADVSLFTPFDQLIDEGGVALVRDHLTDVEDGPLYDSLHGFGSVRSYYNAVRCYGDGRLDGTVHAKGETTVLEAEEMADAYTLLG